MDTVLHSQPFGGTSAGEGSLNPSGRLIFVEHGRSSDPGGVAWQDRITPIWKRIGGSCHLNRKIDDLITGAGFQIVELRTSYLPGPRPMTYTYQDSRIRYKKCIMLESPFTQTDETELAIRRIQWFTIIWMAVEVAVAFMAAIRAHSVALAAFGGTVRSSSCRLQWYSYASAHLAGSRNNLRAKSPPGFWSCLPRILQLTRSTR